MASRTNASVPFMITAKMKYDLKTLGYTDEDIYKMKVDDAHEILNSGLRKGEVKKTYGKKKSSSSSLASYIPTIAALVLTLALVYFVFLPKVDDISAACRVLSESYCIVVSGPQQASAEVLPAPRSNARPSPVTGSMKHELKQLGYSNDEVSKVSIILGLSISQWQVDATGYRAPNPRHKVAQARPADANHGEPPPPAGRRGR
ncbi:unnamed protein product [Aphanomyces euteiches]